MKEPPSAVPALHPARRCTALPRSFDPDVPRPASQVSWVCWMTTRERCVVLMDHDKSLRVLSQGAGEGCGARYVAISGIECDDELRTPYGHGQACAACEHYATLACVTVSSDGCLALAPGRSHLPALPVHLSLAQLPAVASVLVDMLVSPSDE